MLTSPHVHQGLSTQNLMYKVNLALLPVVLLGIIQFGAPALMLMFASVVTALLCEALCLRMHPLALGHVFDGSALLTALLFTLSLPPHAPLWLGRWVPPSPSCWVSISMAGSVRICLTPPCWRAS